MDSPGRAVNFLEIFLQKPSPRPGAGVSFHMKTTISLFLTAGACFLTCLGAVAEAKPAKNAASKATPGCSRFDKDENGELDASEKAALQEAFAAGDTTIRLLDTNNNGKLEESEIAAIKLDGKEKKGGKKNGKKNT